ncbi:MAG: thioredoxin family protein [Desulfobacterium sp.]|nr:thioredoxin family protein [Desulfobacterium sp.]
MITEIQDTEFEASIASGLNMVLFYKDKCPFCNAMKKILIKFSGRPAAAGKGIRYFQINRETNPQTTEALGVTGIPSLFIYRDGEKIAEKSGDVTYRQLDKMVA